MVHSILRPKFYTVVQSGTPLAGAFNEAGVENEFFGSFRRNISER